MTLVRYKNHSYTPDTLDIVKKIESLCLQGKIEGGSIRGGEDASLGRELEIQGENVWSWVIPMGVTPWSRYPVESPEQNKYHVYGPWQIMMDRLMAMGRGDTVWSSFLNAARIEAGTYEGPNPLETEIQTILHRLGYNPGPVDGLMGPQTIRAMADAGVKERADVALERLRRMKTPTRNRPPAKRREGHVSGDLIRIAAVQAFGGVRTIRSETGLVFEVETPGRLIIDLE